MKTRSLVLPVLLALLFPAPFLLSANPEADAAAKALKPAAAAAMPEPAQDAMSPAQDAMSPAQDASSPAQDASSPAQDASSPAQADLSPAPPADEPPRGRELYALLGKGGLVRGGNAPRVTWLPGGGGYVIVERTGGGARRFVRVDPATGRKSPFLDRKKVLAAWKALEGKKQKGFPFRSFAVAPGGDKIGFGSWSAGYVVYDLEKNSMKRFPGIDPEGPRPKLSLAWDRVAFVHGYDLFVAALGEDTPRRFTEGGREELMNGRPDWVYPEELDQYDAFWWSPNGRKLAFLSFDERPVTRYPILHELEPRGRLELERYPKAGGANPVVTLHVADLSSGRIADVDTGRDKDVYIVRCAWSPGGEALFFQRLNRLQNVLELLAADPETGKARVVLREEEPCFVNLSKDLRFLSREKQFLWTSERSGWRHVYLYDTAGRLVRRLTKEDLPVRSIAAVDEEGGWVYFTGYRRRGLETHLFRVGLDGKGFRDLTPEEGTHRIDLAPRGRWFFDSWSSFSAPPRAVLRRGDGKIARAVSTAETRKLEELKLLPVEHVLFKAADGKTDLDGVLFKPADFDPRRKYPLLVHVYGGPHAKTVRDVFMDGGAYQAEAQLGYLVFRMDNRGTPGRGKAFETATYQKLGRVDLADQVAGVRFLEKRPYVDASRVGITGGSYGGYMTCMALLAAPEVFHAGVAVSSVTDWRNYDTIYTERYMRRPKDNPEGYEKGAPVNFAAGLSGELLLVHGTIDDNVHKANTIQLVEKLVAAKKDFELMLYPEQRHGIGGPGRSHLRKLTLAFFQKNLAPEAAGSGRGGR